MSCTSYNPLTALSRDYSSMCVPECTLNNQKDSINTAPDSSLINDKGMLHSEFILSVTFGGWSVLSRSFAKALTTKMYMYLNDVKKNLLKFLRCAKRQLRHKSQEPNLCIIHAFYFHSFFENNHITN